jgi:hypothetical protein
MWDLASRYHRLSPGQADYFIDFPNPLAVVLNPIAYFICLMSLWGAVELTRWVLRKSLLRARSRH